MSQEQQIPGGLVEQLRKVPTHTVLIDLATAAKEAKLLNAPEFKKLLAYVLELADGRDRRETWVSRTPTARPTPKLRVALEKVFGMYADLHWYRLNKTTNNLGKPLTGLFPRVAATMWRVDEQEFALLITALLSPSPDAALLRILNQRSGRIKGMGVELFSRVAFAFRRDLYFPIPKPWGESSGCLRYVGNDLRRYCGLCRNLRAVCDGLDIPSDVRGSVLHHLLTMPKPPASLMEALHKAIGPSLAKFGGMRADEAYEGNGADDEMAQPMEVAGRAIRARRGRRSLRESLCKHYGDRCAISGNCVKDLLEVAYIVPYPAGDVHSPSNALLLRSDLHTLWDLNLIAIEPKSNRVYIAPQLSGTSYEKIAGRTLGQGSDRIAVSGEVLAERWRIFASAHGEEKPKAIGDTTLKRPGETARPEAQQPGRMAEKVAASGD